MTYSMKTPFKLKSGNASSFKNLGSSPVKQEEFIKYNAAGQRVNMMGVPHGTPKSKLTDIGSLKPEHKGLYKQKGTVPPKKAIVPKQYPGQEISDKLTQAVNKTIPKTSKKIVHKGAVNIAKNVGKKVAKFAAKRLGPIGTVLTAYEVGKTIPKVSKATVEGLKKRAKSGNVNLGRKL